VATGNQWARITVPSKEVTLQSVGVPGTGAATTATDEIGRWQAVVMAGRGLAVEEVVEGLVVAGVAEDEEQPASDPRTMMARIPDRPRWCGA